MKDKPTVSGDYLVKKERTNRVKVVEHGGWPNWIDESVIVNRVTPLGIHTFTPAASPVTRSLLQQPREDEDQDSCKKNKVGSQPSLSGLNGFRVDLPD
ncbi:hypothetical protein NC652_024896 [Populus alba x Populus x berolinensis]|nr:hypothetical protein NC652_024896 [Populus alba x Populus x berolinensis]